MQSVPASLGSLAAETAERPTPVIFERPTFTKPALLVGRGYRTPDIGSAVHPESHRHEPSLTFAPLDTSSMYPLILGKRRSRGRERSASREPPVASDAFLGLAAVAESAGELTCNSWSWGCI
jgi:hypothetical protein